MMETVKSNKKVMWHNTITNIQARVLEGLARYQYLTFSQMSALGVGASHYQYLWKQVASIRDRKRPLVKCHNFSTPQPKRGRVESLYFLTQHGKNALINELHLHEEEIKKPTSRTVAYKDYHHRKQTIDFRIQLDKWAKNQDLTVPFFDTYFEKSSNSNGELRAKTRIDIKGGDYIIPDGAFEIIGDQKKEFFLFELHRGADNARLIRQLDKHARCLTYRSTHGKYGLPVKKGYKIILLFELDSIKDAFVKRMGKDGFAFKKVQQYFLSKSISDLGQGDFNGGWTTLFGDRVVFFD